MHQWHFFCSHLTLEHELTDDTYFVKIFLYRRFLFLSFNENEQYMNSVSVLVIFEQFSLKTENVFSTIPELVSIYIVFVNEVLLLRNLNISNVINWAIQSHSESTFCKVKALNQFICQLIVEMIITETNICFLKS